MVESEIIVFCLQFILLKIRILKKNFQNFGKMFKILKEWPKLFKKKCPIF